MAAGFKDHFSHRSDRYAAHRPSYPAALSDFLADTAPGRTLALDAGCGSGQLAVPLADRFGRVVATDASAAQIAAATPHARIDYRVAPAERSRLDDGCVDLVTAAQAAHWFDLPAFYAEARRIALPGGVIALIAYGTPTVADEAVDAVLRRFYHDTLRGYWPPERAHVERGYATLPFPFAALPAPAFAIERSWEVDDLIGYVETWSAVAALIAAGGAPIAPLRDTLTAVWPAVGRCAIHWPIALRIGRIDR